MFLDFSKAFDTVPHQRFLLKLQHYGIRGSNLVAHQKGHNATSAKFEIASYVYIHS